MSQSSDGHNLVLLGFDEIFDAFVEGIDFLLEIFFHAVLVIVGHGIVILEQR